MSAHSHGSVSHECGNPTPAQSQKDQVTEPTRISEPTWGELVRESADRLAEAGVPSPCVDARELAENVAGESRFLECVPTKEQCLRFEHLIARRAARIPLQHLTGRMYFRYLELVSRPGCFIVRPETEMVAEAAIRAARAAGSFSSNQRGIRVVDMCTGSGAIALAIATEVPTARVSAVEISPQAFALAVENNHAYGDRVTLIQEDALTWLPAQPVDIVVSNPPYVPAGTEHSPEVQADPAIALWGGGDDGLDFPRALLARARTMLVPGGILIMEHAPSQARELREVARAAGYDQVSTGCDLTGRERFLQARWP